ncbi:hypothetical protein Tco_0651060 [Tanacetum coccineum]
MSSIAKFDVKKFDGSNDFGLWRVKMRCLLIQHGWEAALDLFPKTMTDADKTAALKTDVYKKAHSALLLCLDNKVLREVNKENSAEGLIDDLANIDVDIDDEDQALMLLTSLPSSYDNFVEMLLYGRDSLTLEDILSSLNLRELKKSTRVQMEKMVKFGAEYCAVTFPSGREIWIFLGHSWTLDIVGVLLDGGLKSGEAYLGLHELENKEVLGIKVLGTDRSSVKIVFLETRSRVLLGLGSMVVASYFLSIVNDYIKVGLGFRFLGLKYDGCSEVQSSDPEKDVKFEVISLGVNLFVTACEDYELEQLDVKTKFFACIPKGSTFDVYMINNEFSRNSYDSCVYFKEFASDVEKNEYVSHFANAVVLEGALLDVGRRLINGWQSRVNLRSVVVNCDNQSAIHLSRNAMFHERTKHINVRYHFIREIVESKEIEVAKIGMKDNAADVFTKVIPGPKFKYCM